MIGSDDVVLYSVDCDCGTVWIATTGIVVCWYFLVLKRTRERKEVCYSYKLLSLSSIVLVNMNSQRNGNPVTLL